MECWFCNTFDDTTNLENIMKIFIPRQNNEDKRVWLFNKSRELSIKSTFGILSDNGRPQHLSVVVWKDFWKSNYYKVVFFLDETILELPFRFANGWTLMELVMVLDVLYARKNEETNIHAQCEHAREAWFGSSMGLLTIKSIYVAW